MPATHRLKGLNMTTIAILDDYQNVALTMAD